MGGECIEEQLVYQATVKVKVPDDAPEEEKVPDETYLGVTDPEWKLRHGNHKQDFKKPAHRGRTCLSKYIWSLKDKGLVEDIGYSISWALITSESHTHTNIFDMKLTLLIVVLFCFIPLVYLMIGSTL